MQSQITTIDPKVLASLDGLHIAARRLVDGFMSGLHRSSHKGFNVEFTEHRSFQPGDDPKNLDWKVLCRTDRYYVKQYEEDSSLRAMFLLDHSGSMKYGRKWDWARTATACLAYMAINQGDSAGLSLAGKSGSIIPPRSSMSHLSALLSVLVSTQVQGSDTLASAMGALGNALKRRSLIVIIGDILEDPVAFVKAAGLLRHKKHDLLVMQVLDRDELSFPFKGSVLFTDLESPSRVITYAGGIKREYIKAINAHINTLKSGLASRDIDFLTMSTETPLEKSLSTYLARRMRN